MQSVTGCIAGAALLVAFILAVGFGLLVLFAELVGSIGADTMSLVTILLLAIALAALVTRGTKSIFNMRYERESQMLELERRRIRLDLIEPNYNGLLPVPVAGLHDPNILYRVLDTHQERQRSNKRVPQTLTYSPHMRYANSTDVLPVPNDDRLLPADGGATNTPTFWRLVEDGQLPSDKLLLGFDAEDNEPVVATWHQLYSSLVGGVSGSGKSTAVRNILAQSALQGANFMVIDPHLHAGDESLGHSLQPLRSLMIADVACEDTEIVQTLLYFLDIAKARLDGRDGNREPLILVVDEVTALLQRGEQRELLSSALQMIATETRKIGVYAMCIGQNFHSKIIDTTIRNNFASSLGCKMKKSVGRVMTEDNEFGHAVSKLSIGQAVWLPAMGGMVTLNVPNCTEDDIIRVAQRKSLSTTGDASFREASGKRPVSVHDGNDHSDFAIMEATRKLDGRFTEASHSAESQRILSMFRSGEDMTEITKVVYEFDKAGGRAYQDRLAHVNAVIRGAI